MKRVLMPELGSRKYRIPAGWVVMVPDFTADPDYVNALTGILMPKHAHHRIKANEDAKTRVDTMCRSFYLHGLKLFVQRCADEYGKRYPDLVGKDKTLAGFDASLVSGQYVPYRKSSGRHPMPEITRILVHMATEAREKVARMTVKAPGVASNRDGGF
jgi:hypothetical protein